MATTKILLAVVALTTAAPSALKPTEGAITPHNNKTVTVFKTTPQGDLKMNLYFPKDWKSTDRRPAIVFFFGGGFVAGSPVQFTTKAEYLAGRGMVAASAEYRIGNTHHTGPEKCIEDAASQKHGFFNDRGGTPWHAVVLRQTDLFLSSLGFLKGQPAVAISTSDQALTKELP
jgi:hypothetical protein